MSNRIYFALTYLFVIPLKAGLNCAIASKLSKIFSAHDNKLPKSETVDTYGFEPKPAPLTRYQNILIFSEELWS